MLVFCHYILSIIQRYAIRLNKRELHCVRANVFGDLKKFLRRSLASLARAYKLLFFLFFCRYIWGSCPPPQYQKAGYASGGGGGETRHCPPPLFLGGGILKFSSPSNADSSISVLGRGYNMRFYKSTLDKIF